MLNKYTIGAIITIVVIGLIWTYGKVQYNQGYENRDIQAQIEIKDLRLKLEEEKSDEIDRINKANRLAQENSTKRLLQIQVEKDQLEKLLEDQENEASKDPDSNRIGLGAPSVLRINKIR